MVVSSHRVFSSYFRTISSLVAVALPPPGAEALYDLPLTKATLGCKDDWNLLDHFDPTADLRRLFKQFFDLRATYGVLNDGFSLLQHGNWTHEVFLSFSNGS